MPRQEHEKSDLLLFNYSKKAKSFFNKHKKVRDEFEDNIEKYYLRGQTDGINIKKMSGSQKWIRMRVNDGYRVIYAIFRNQIIIVDVMLAGNRGEVYKQYNKR